MRVFDGLFAFVDFVSVCMAVLMLWIEILKMEIVGGMYKIIVWLLRAI